MMRYKTRGTCSSYIDFEISDGVLTDVKFGGGCSGNTQGIASLVNGMKVDDVIEKLKGIRCGYRATSCPDQLAKALEEAKNS